MEDLDFLKKWCLAHLKFDKEIFLKDNFLNQEAKDELVAEVRKVEDRVLFYYNNKNIRKLKFFFKSFNQDACPPNDPDYPLRMGEKPKNRIVEMRYKIETRKVWICYHS